MHRRFRAPGGGCAQGGDPRGERRVAHADSRAQRAAASLGTLRPASCWLGVAATPSRTSPGSGGAGARGIAGTRARRGRVCAARVLAARAARANTGEEGGLGAPRRTARRHVGFARGVRAERGKRVARLRDTGTLGASYRHAGTGDSVGSVGDRAGHSDRPQGGRARTGAHSPARDRRSAAPLGTRAALRARGELHPVPRAGRASARARVPTRAAVRPAGCPRPNHR